MAKGKKGKEESLEVEALEAEAKPAKPAKPAKSAKKMRLRGGGVPGAGFSRIVLLVLINILLLAVIVMILNWNEMIDVEKYMAPFLANRVETEDPREKVELEIRELKKAWDLDRIKWEKNSSVLEMKTHEYVLRENQLRKRLEEMDKPADKEERDKQLAANEKEKLFQIVSYLYNMPPQKAVDILNQKSNPEIQEFLEAHEEWCTANEKQSMGAYYLSLMPKETSSEVLKLLRAKPAEMTDPQEIL